MTRANDEMEMRHTEDNKVVQDSIALIDRLTAERDQAVVDCDSFREQMRRHRSEHARCQSNMMAQVHEQHAPDHQPLKVGAALPQPVGSPC